MTPTNPWSAALRRAGRLADGFDRARPVPQTLVPAALWAVARTTVGAVGAPVVTPALLAAAMRTSQLAAARIDALPEHLHALAEGRPVPLPADRTVRLDGSQRYLITSDLHRCTPGKVDWPRRQGVKELYARVLAGYAEDDWHLIENGDVEDFWMVGGSTWSVLYDVAGLAGVATGPLRSTLHQATAAEHLSRIVENNVGTYDLLRDGFVAAGRYHRTMGNHDDAYSDADTVAHLGTHLPGTVVADTILLTADGSSPADGIGGVDAVVAHGHLTDSWNGPGFAALGRAATWIATGLADLPLAGSNDDDRLADEPSVGHLLGGRGRNRLITVDPRFGGNRRFDSLDEQRMFARLAEDEPDGGWPWIIHGHTHRPMLRPLDARGLPVRYANSGCGVLDRAFTALEWDGSRPEDPVTLVAWVDRPEGPQRIELVPDGPVLRTA